jgi:S1-C subfamily serine protease
MKRDALRRFSRIVLAAACSAALVSLGAVGCGGKTEEAEQKSPAPTKTAPAASPNQVAATPVAKANTGGQVSAPQSGNVAAGRPDSKPEPQPAAPELVSFSVIPTTEPVTSMALSEDGQRLAMSHQAAGQISIWNVRAGTFERSISTPSPRSLLYRGNQLIVANDGEGTISVFQQNGDWKLVKQVKMPGDHIVHISAAQRDAFKGDLLATIHGKGPEASYQRAMVYHVDVNTGKVNEAARSSLASVSADGNIVLTQGSFNLSPSGGIGGHRWKTYISGDTGSPVFRGGIQQTPYIYQVHPGSYWLAKDIVFGGIPLRVVKKDIKNLLIPDLSQPVVYALTLTSLTAHRLDVELSELGRRTAEFPPKQTKDFGGLYLDLYRRRGYLLDHPVAFTHGKVLYLFAIDIHSNVVLTARTAAIVARGANVGFVGARPAIPEPRPRGGNSPQAIPRKRPAVAGSTRGNLPNLGIPTRLVVKQILAHTLAGPPRARFQLVKGPKGMRIIGTNLNWRPTIADVGRHDLRIKVTSGGKVSFIAAQIEVVLQSAGGRIADLKGLAKLRLEVDHWQLTPGLGYRSLLLLQGSTLKRLGPDGLNVVKTMKLPGSYRFIAERHDEFLAVCTSPFRLDVIDKRTLKARKQISLTSAGVRVLEVTDLAIHPRRHTSFVAIKHDIDLPRYRVLVVDERKGEASAPPDVMGTWLAADPEGRYLYAAYRDIYERGARFHINPGGNIIRMPKYGNVDWLITYDLRRGTPVARQAHFAAGGNGQGIRLSADGKRVVYLSYVGYPTFSGDLGAFNPANLKGASVAYPTKAAGAVTTKLAFHPSLDIVAVPGKKPSELPVMIFDRETGKPLPGTLPAPAGGLGSAKVERVMFAPDGRSLLFLCSGLDGLSLLKLPLKLTPAQLRRAAQGPRIPTARSVFADSSTRKVVGVIVKREDLDALKKPAASAPLKAKDIARRFTPAVVLIQNGESIASGFIVGNRGYVLTCAHAIPAEGRIFVSYQSVRRSRKATRKAIAALIRLDEKRDLALLRFNPYGTLTSIAISDEKTVEAGEEVTVIGNPGLGSRVLSNTLTTGVVSSPRREIDGQDYIQTSAAVNRGNSGGPMFDSRGRVIGLVALKARIENTGFAVPATSLRAFLEAATKRRK